MKKQKKREFKMFMRGVFWTLFIGMAAYIAAPAAKVAVAESGEIETAYIDKIDVNDLLKGE